MKEEYTHAPHREGGSGTGPSPNAALLIDFDNVTMAIRSNLGQELRNFLNSDIVRGQVSVQRAYADWRRYPQYIVPLSEASIDLIFAPAYGSTKKNATDIRLAIDALELVFTRPEIGTYILLSGDSDFSSLVLKLKEYGKYVIGVGLQESSSDLLVQNCDEYYSYNSLSGLTSAEQMTTDRHDPWELVEMAVQKMEERDDVMRSDRLKQVMLELDSGFDEKNLGFSKFNRFLAEASSKGLVRLRRIENGQYEVAAAGGGAAAKKATGDGGRAAAASGEKARDRSSNGGRGGGRRSDRAAARSRGPRGSGDGEARSGAPAAVEVDSLREAYRLLRDVVGDLSSAGEGVRDSEVKREMLRRKRRFDEAELGFSKFSRFLRQAYDEGVVDLTTDDDGNYHVSTVGDDADAASPAPPADEPGRRQETAEAGKPDAPRQETAEAEKPDEPDRDESPQEESPRPRRRGGLGRFRRGSRGPDEPSETPASVGVVSTDAETETGTDSDTETATDEGAAEERSDDEPGRDDGSAPERTGERRRARGGLGRFRRGRRGGSSPTASQKPEEDAPSGTTAEEPRATAGDAPAAETASREAPTPDVPEDPVAYMADRYTGVGRKTAEKLVDTFGDDIFRVIDEEPERLSEVLPEHRARAVAAARRAERS